MKLRFSRYLAAILGLALLAGIGVVAHSEAPVASADGFGRTEVTFTKWVTEFPPGGVPVIANMEGVVGGDVGNGTFAGEVLTFEAIGNGKISKITADYHLNGSAHQSTARMHVWQFDAKFAVVTGAVTDGWKKGATVFGTYKVIPCTQAPIEGLCYQGTLYFVGGGS
ncbi:MAG TPA: hypothetical protein VIB47_13960 [Dehalococcoidia bacterium]